MPGISKDTHMKLIGMLDSPYVRRVAVVLDLMQIAFEHEAVSVFTTFERFQAINPVVKAPTLVCDDGTVLMDSSLILHYAEHLAGPARSLWPSSPDALAPELRALGLALAACDKTVQWVYERQLRPAAAQHEPWLARVLGQLQAAYAGLEREVAARAEAFAVPTHASLMAAIAWQFSQAQIATEVKSDRHPALAALSQRFEATERFRRYPPVGPGVPALPATP